VRSRRSTLALLVAAGCGDPLVELGFKGDDAFVFEAAVRLVEARPRTEDTRVSVFWSLGAGTSTRAGELAEHPRAAAPLSFPGAFTMAVFGPPPQVGSERGFEVGEILVWESTEGGSERLLGGSADRVLLYAPADLGPDRSPTGWPLPAGYSLAWAPLACRDNSAGALERGSEECGVVLGAPCNSSEDCGAGQCALEGYPGGACVLRAGGCAPLGGVKVLAADFFEGGPVDPGGPPPPGSVEVWFKSCERHADCRRGEGYACAPWGACVPQIAVDLDLRLEFEIAPLCQP
jgi:hypothetical protein